MQIPLPQGQFNQWGSVSFQLPLEVASRINTVDQLVMSNNALDSILSDVKQRVSGLHAQVSVLTDTINRIGAVVIEIDGKEYPIGKLALQKAQLTKALTFDDSSAGRPA